MEAIGRARQPRSAVLRTEALDIEVLEAEDAEDVVDRSRVLAVLDVDPQQPLRAERLDDLVGELDRAVRAGCVEEPGGDTAQWIRPINPAAAAATTATKYCNASMIRSWAGSVSHDPDPLVVGSINIR